METAIRKYKIKDEDMTKKLNDEEKLTIALRSLKIPYEDVHQLFTEVLKKGVYDECELDCVGEWDDNEYEEGYDIGFEYMQLSLYQKLSKNARRIVDICFANNIKEIRVNKDDVGEVIGCKRIKEKNIPVTLQDVIDFAQRSKIDDPSIWIIDAENDDYDQACRMEDIDLDEDGDIIIKVNMELLGDY